MASAVSNPQVLSAEEVLELLGSRPDGLSQAEAEERLRLNGPNLLAPVKKSSSWLILLRQFLNLLIAILLAASVISFLLGENLDAWLILAIILACVVLGFIQEYRAEQAAAALRQLAAPEATVVREGKEAVVPAREVVPGDVLALHQGDMVAADARLLAQFNLKADESLLTGESLGVDKDPAPVAAEAALDEQRGMVFGGTVITYGRGRGVVTATGMDTQFGSIARLLAEVPEEPTPLEKRMATVGRLLSAICLAAAVGAALMGVLRGHPWLEMLIWGITLAVAAVPESLPAVVTGALAIGTTRMARRHAIVKRLPAVETMGCTTVICTDKTGTLTRNEMTARRLFLDGREIEVTGWGYEPLGKFREAGRDLRPGQEPLLAMAARISLLCNDAGLEVRDGLWTVRGDPTEGALLALARKALPASQQVLAAFPRVAELPFSAETKRMSTFHQGPDGLLQCLKGSPEGLLHNSSRVLTAQGERPITAEDRRLIHQEAGRMAQDALRVLGLAYRPLKSLPPATVAAEAEADDLVWVGLVGLMDPPRPEARKAVTRCRRAGIRVIMVTGDHPDTAGAIAREVGLIPEEKAAVVLSGKEINQLSDAELKEALRNIRVFARVSSGHKLRLVGLLKGQGEVVAMTGDGVNDAPALKRADIGVAMGHSGTAVAREAAAMILADDNFASLVAAVEEGRAIFDNIKKYLVYLLSCNLAEILVLCGTFLLGLPLPLVALQILWVNLTTDGLPALALGVDPKAPDIMRRPPRPPREGVFTPTVHFLLMVISLYLTAILIPLFAYYVYWNPGGLVSPEQVLVRARTMVFTTLVLVELVNAFNCRSDYHSLFTTGLFGNHFLNLAVLLSLLMMVAVIEWPPLGRLFHTAPLGWHDWLLAALLSLSVLPVVEAAKWWLRRGMGKGRG